MIDSHCHLTDPNLYAQLAAVLSRANANGVTRFITIGTGIQDDLAAIALAAKHANIRCAIGIHPNYSQEHGLSDVEKLREMQRSRVVVALGEMGLDYFHQFADRKHQAQIFESQMQLASEVKKPVVIHSREAIEDTLAIMRSFPQVPAVFHCFTGTRAEAEKIIAQGYLIGFTGALTYKKNQELRDIARDLPADRILVETDAPYLTPEPMRKQKINEPGLVVHVADMLGAARGVNREEIDRLTTANASRFFEWY